MCLKTYFSGFLFFFLGIPFFGYAGTENSKDPQTGGTQNALVVGPSVQQKGLYVYSFSWQLF